MTINGLPEPRRSWAMAAIMVSMGMAVLDGAIANTALPVIARDLGATPAASVWIVNAYQIAVVATLLPLAALGDILGHRRIYVGGMVLFVLASVGCALAESLPWLVAARLVQGLGASGIMSVNAALIRYIYPPARLGRGMGLNALAVGIAFVAGPTVASGILAIAHWPWLFAVNAPVGVLAVALALAFLPETGRAAQAFDPVAGLLSVGLFAGLVLAVGDAAHGAGWPRLGAEAGFALACGALMIWRQAVVPAPLLGLDILRRPHFALSVATAVGAYAAQGIAFVSLPFLFQDVLQRSPVETGFLMTPWPLVVAAMAPVAGRWSDRWSPGLLGGIGLAVLSAGLLLLALLPGGPSLYTVLWRLALCGAGFGFFQSPNLRALMTSAPPERSGSASGLLAIGRLIGQTCGAALAAACFGLSAKHGPVVALGLGSAFSALASLTSFARLPAGRPTGAGDVRRS